MHSDLLALGEALPSPTPHLAARRAGSVGYLIFNRPERRNAVSLEMWEAIPALMRAFDEDPAIRAVVLAGAGDQAFIAGADISEFEGERNSAESAALYEERNSAAYRAIAESPKSVIAMIHGFCIGGGMAIALACDIRIAAEGSTFAIPAARLGLAYPPEAMALLVRAVGPSRAKLILHTARRFSSDEALAMGLVDLVAPRTELLARVGELTDAISDNAPLTIAAANATIDAVLGSFGLDDNARAAIARCFASDDYREGRQAFMEKRRPIFRGS